ncbi:hypothetical protein [Kluyvera ascorbata]|uniref:hypothetical protein n=1 Tax=Kluyvera ascorbata TaxID=51288 RepID=UPI000DFAFD66|nr:hypothetical protein [Kluyvera ascorbata]BCA38924.1 hypothetical protein KATP_14460 [Kluyvera ascorbata]STW98165.1 Uncharacterised protein [Kluyvera ascorbata]HBL0731241.1 hypothetical protein [Kluyvera ascorbata]
MNKITIAVVVTLFSFPVVMPKAQAISEGYRNQLERSGCNQLNAGVSCDIHKTAKQNQQAQANAKINYSWGAVKAECEEIIGMDSGKLYDYLMHKGWNHTAYGEWSKGQYKIHYVVEGGKVINAQLTK